MNKPFAVFDLDGTLLNTLQDLANSVNFAMTQLGLPTYNADEVRMMIGNGVSVLMSRALTAKHQHLHAQALAMQRDYYGRHTLDTTVPYDGVSAALARLKQMGVTVVVHSNKDENFARDLCARFFGDKVDYVCGTVPGCATKPNAERLTKLLAEHGATSAVYIGDSDVDIQTAANAGLPCLSVAWGFRDAEYLVAHGAAHIVDSPDQIPNLVQQFAGQCNCQKSVKQ